MTLKEAIVPILNDTSLNHIDKIILIREVHASLPRNSFSLKEQKKDFLFFYFLNSTDYFWANSVRVRDPKDWEDLAPQVFAVIREYIESDILEYDDWDKYIELKAALRNRWDETYYKYPRSLHEGDKS